MQPGDGRVAVMTESDRLRVLLIMADMIENVQRLTIDFEELKQAADDWRKETEPNKGKV